MATAGSEFGEAVMRGGSEKDQETEVQHEGDTHCEIKMEKAEEGRNLERGGRHVKNKMWGWTYMTEKTKKKRCSRQSWPERAKVIRPCSKCTK